MFPYAYLHLGGDEVDYTCWTESKEIQTWAHEQGMRGNEDIYKYFLDRAASISREQGRVPVQWVEVFEHFGRCVYVDINDLWIYCSCCGLIDDT
jgi:hexosaminidase